jgi:hypothetical protein
MGCASSKPDEARQVNDAIEQQLRADRARMRKEVKVRPKEQALEHGVGDV